MKLRRMNLKGKDYHPFAQIFPEKDEATKNQKVAIVVVILSILLIMLVMPWFIEGNLMGSSTVSNQLKVRQLAPEDLYVKRAFEYEDVNKTNALRDEAIKEVSPSFEFDKKATYDSFSNLNNFVKNFASMTSSEMVSYLSDLNDDELLFVKSQFNILTADQKEEISQWLDQIGKMAIDAGFANSSQIIGVEEDGYSSIKIEGTVDNLFDKSNKDLKRDVSIDEILTADNMQSFVEDKINDYRITSTGYDHELFTVLLKGVLSTNLVYDSVVTSLERNEAYESVPPQNVYIAAGQKVLVKDSIITQADLDLLKQVEINKSLYSTAQIISREILIVLVTLICYYFFFTSNKGSSRRMSFTLVYLIIMLATLLLTTVLISFSDFFHATVLGPLLPVVFGALFLNNLTGSKKFGFVFTLQYAFYAALFPGTTWFTFFYIATIGISFIFLINYQQDRLINNISVLKAMVVAILMTVLLYAIQGFPFNDIAYSILNVSLNCVLCLGVEKFALPYVDSYLNIPTIFRLRELEKLDAPLLKKLKIQANGTFNHSIGVSDLAVAAAKEVGADENLCKIAALYHDVGKMEHPEYFTENQIEGDTSKHDELSPTISAAMIRSHVRLSVEKCREEGLPFEVITIISEHHGNDVISFFYNEAREKAGENTNVSIADFSYTGNPPSSKESAIVMLSDCVEAASHSIKDITPQKISRMVGNIIKTKFENNQLNDSRLDLTELKMIQTALEKSLMGKYHTRIAYPEEEKKAKMLNTTKN